MAEERVKRKLTTILATDVDGYARLMHANEEATLKTLGEYREIIDGLISRHDGQVFSTGGDSVLAEFDSAVEAMRCAVAVQQELAVRDAEQPVERRVRFRIGINVGDVMVKDGDLLGDGVNVAARLEGLAEPGGICISGSTFDQVRNKLSLDFEDLGLQQVKNIAEPIQAYRVVRGPGQEKVSAPPLRQKTSRTPHLMAAAALILAAGLGALWFATRLPLPPKTSADRAASENGQVTTETPAAIAANKPSIAVLPFTNMSGDKEQEYFSDGMTEDLLTDLSKISSISVISRSSTFAYKGLSPDVRAVAKELGVSHVVEGSVRKADGRVRITAQLIDAATGTHLWAERYDRDIADIFSLQDEVRGKIVAALRVTLTPSEKRRLARHKTENTEAYDLYLQGLRQISFFTLEGNRESRRLFEQATAVDPNFAEAYAQLAQAYSLAEENGWLPETDGVPQKALALAQKAVELDGESPQAHWSLGRILTRPPFRDPQRALVELTRTVELDPNYADGHAFLANVLNYVGRAEEALGIVETAIRINPHHPFWYVYLKGQCLFLLGRYEEAIPNFELAIERNPTVAWPHRFLLATYGHLGRLEDAEWEMSELESLGQSRTIKSVQATSPIVYPDYLNRYLDGLRKAGVPEE